MPGKCYNNTNPTANGGIKHNTTLIFTSYLYWPVRLQEYTYSRKDLMLHNYYSCKILVYVVTYFSFHYPLLCFHYSQTSTHLVTKQDISESPLCVLKVWFLIMSVAGNTLSTPFSGCLRTNQFLFVLLIM